MSYKDKGGERKRGGFRGKGGFSTRGGSASGGKKKRFEKKGTYKKKELGARDEGEEKKFEKREEGAFKKKRFGQAGAEFKKKRFEKRDGPYKKKEFGSSTEDGKKFAKQGGGDEGGYQDKKKPFQKKAGGFDRKRSAGGYKGQTGAFTKSFKKNYKKIKSESSAYVEKAGDGTIRLNKYIANAGICSRREADELIAAGVVKVNGEIITQMGYKVKPGDVVNYGGQTLKQERLQYVLLNKPKDYITTLDDPEGRKNVMELVKNACHERIYPVGRLDRTTTGVLLFTNDGELTKRLTHPRYGIKKIYHVMLDQNLKRSDLEAIREGIELEDGPIKPDAIDYAGDAKNEVGIEIHSGRNRIVRRIFEKFNYKVVKLDRVYFAGLTKKDLPRGHWRHLEEKELNMLRIVAGK